MSTCKAETDSDTKNNLKLQRADEREKGQTRTMRVNRYILLRTK